MGIYDNEGIRHQKSVRLTTHQEQKLNHLCQVFGIGYQRFFSDCIDFFSMQLYDVISGRISISQALKTSMLELVDDYIKLKEVKGLVPKTYIQERV